MRVANRMVDVVQALYISLVAYSAKFGLRVHRCECASKEKKFPPPLVPDPLRVGANSPKTTS